MIIFLIGILIVVGMFISLLFEKEQELSPEQFDEGLKKLLDGKL